MRLWRRRRSDRIEAPGLDRIHAARRLQVRTRRQVTDHFAGLYVSALRGAGIEYAESRPYVPGDDVQRFDWNATARTGVPHVKQHRPERGRTVLAVLDTSETMRFGPPGRSKLEAAAEAIALLGAAALSAGDRFGLIRHAACGLDVLEPGRGELQLHRLLRALAETTAAPPTSPRGEATASPTSLIERRRRAGAVIFSFSDARAGVSSTLHTPEHAAAHGAAPTPRSLPGGEGIFVLCSDRGELRWPIAGRARVSTADGGPLVFDGDDALARSRFERAAEQRVTRLRHEVRTRGDDFVHFRTDGDALRLWLRFFSNRAASGVREA